MDSHQEEAGPEEAAEDAEFIASCNDDSRALDLAQKDISLKMFGLFQKLQSLSEDAAILETAMQLRQTEDTYIQLAQGLQSIEAEKNSTQAIYNRWGRRQQAVGTYKKQLRDMDVMMLQMGRLNHR